MGASHSATLKREELEDLYKRNHYERREIRLLYKQFREEAPSGKISRKDFNALTSAMGISDQTITKLVFDAFDSNSDEKIEFEAQGMCIVAFPQSQSIDLLVPLEGLHSSSEDSLNSTALIILGLLLLVFSLSLCD